MTWQTSTVFTFICNMYNSGKTGMHTCMHLQTAHSGDVKTWRANNAIIKNLVPSSLKHRVRSQITLLSETANTFLT